MFLPEIVLRCIQALEQAGYQVYAVGGCVRDSLLGIQPHDYDLCTNATPEQTSQVFADYRLVRSGEKHGTIGVVMDGSVLEITTFRTEGGYQDSRHPDWVRFVDAIEEDLARRDFTVNAMAYSPRTGYIDPWGGQADLQNRILRAVGDPTTRFTEDALRILRGVRFAARFNLTPEPETEQAMFCLSSSLAHLAKERVFEELCNLLLVTSAADLLRFAPVLAQAIPQLRCCVGFEQHSPYHSYDVFTHIAHVVENSPRELPLRWAALLHDSGKPACFTQDETGRGHFKDHAKVSAAIAEEVLCDLKAPTALREQVVWLVGHHMTTIEPDKKILRRRLGRYGVENTLTLLTLQQADMCSKGPGRPTKSEHFAAVRLLIDEVLQEDACLHTKDLAIDGNDLIALGFTPGKEIGACLSELLWLVQDEQLPNDKSALLSRAAQFLREDRV